MHVRAGDPQPEPSWLAKTPDEIRIKIDRKRKHV